MTLRNDGTGTFGAPQVRVAPPAGVHWSGLRFGELNGDGHLDVLALTQGSLQPLFGNAAGGFTVGPLQSFTAQQVSRIEAVDPS